MGENSLGSQAFPVQQGGGGVGGGGGGGGGTSPPLKWAMINSKKHTHNTGQS